MPDDMTELRNFVAEFERIEPRSNNNVRKDVARPTTVLERLGYVLGWLGNIFAIVAMVGTAGFLILLATTGREKDPSIFWFFGLSGCAVALVLFGSGRALRYIFSGKQMTG
jgi:hypothetical protein